SASTQLTPTQNGGPGLDDRQASKSTHARSMHWAGGGRDGGAASRGQGAGGLATGTPSRETGATHPGIRADRRAEPVNRQGGNSG
ncbi:MAG: hypothetical protein M0Z34_11230, partial [Nitrospiraceae bacterium]|nr:hypothetical protein [Nitrospiraceae bacterium]